MGRLMVFDRVLAVWGVAAVALCAPVSAALASPYSAVYAFGDSLTDNGNLAEVYYQQSLPNPPSYHDSFSNGPVAVSLLAQSLGLTLTPSLWVTAFQDTFGLFGGPSYQPGTNYAVAAATAQAQAVGGPPAINLPQQVAAFGAATALQADPSALYVIMIGSNDVLDGTLAGSGPSAISAAVATELGAIQALASEGARDFLVVNVPNLGLAPEFQQQNASLVATATAYSQMYDQLLAAGLAGLALPAGADVTPFDLYSYDTSLFANAASYGLTDTTDPCYTMTPLLAATTAACGPNGANIGSFVFWDSEHPTGAVQALWAQGMENALAVPEPASLWVLAVGALAAFSRRRVRGSGGDVRAG